MREVLQQFATAFRDDFLLNKISIVDYYFECSYELPNERRCMFLTEEPRNQGHYNDMVFKFLNNFKTRYDILCCLDYHYKHNEFDPHFIDYIRYETLLRKDRLSEESGSVAFDGFIRFVQSFNRGYKEMLDYCLEWCDIIDYLNERDEEEARGFEYDPALTNNDCVSKPDDGSTTLQSNTIVISHNSSAIDVNNKSIEERMDSISEKNVEAEINQTVESKNKKNTLPFTFEINHPIFEGLNRYYIIQLFLSLFTGKDVRGKLYFTVNGKKATQEHLITILRFFKVFNCTKDGGIAADATILAEIKKVTSSAERSKCRIKLMQREEFHARFQLMISLLCLFRCSKGHESCELLG